MTGNSSRRDFLKKAAVTVSSPAVLGRRTPVNVMILLSDDHRYDLLGARGHPWRTPHLDGLLARSAAFRNAFTTTLCARQAAPRS